MLIITGVFEEKTMLRLQDKNQQLQECLYLLAFLDDFDDNNGRREMTYFLILSMAVTTATCWGPSDERRTWRTSQSGLFRGPQQHSENLWFENVNISKDVWQKWATHGSEQGWRTFQSGLFRGPQQHSGKCRIEKVNGTAVLLKDTRSSPRGQTSPHQSISKVYG